MFRIASSPFNFRAEDPVRRGHAVQYISSPIYTWQKLRTDHSAKYENAVNPVWVDNFGGDFANFKIIPT